MYLTAPTCAAARRAKDAPRTRLRVAIAWTIVPVDVSVHGNVWTVTDSLERVCDSALFQKGTCATVAVLLLCCCKPSDGGDRANVHGGITMPGRLGGTTECRAQNVFASTREVDIRARLQGYAGL